MGRLVKWLLHSGGGLEINLSESTNFRGHLQDPSPTKALEMDELERWPGHYHGECKEAPNKTVWTAGNIFNTGAAGKSLPSHS